MIKNIRLFLGIAVIALALVAVFAGTSNASLVTVDEWGMGRMLDWRCLQRSSQILQGVCLRCLHTRYRSSPSWY